MYWKVPRIVPCAVRFGAVGSIDAPPASNRRARLRQSEVEQLRARLREHDVAGLQIPVDDARAVRLVERRRDLDRRLERLVDRERALRQPIRQRLAFEILHDEERGAVLLADVVQRADVRMIELRDRAGFAIEALAELRVGGEGVGENLDRDRAIEPRVAGFVHLAHPAGADERQDLVRAEASAGVERHQWRRGLYRRALLSRTD